MRLESCQHPPRFFCIYYAEKTIRNLFLYPYNKLDAAYYYPLHNPALISISTKHAKDWILYKGLLFIENKCISRLLTTDRHDSMTLNDMSLCHFESPIMSCQDLLTGFNSDDLQIVERY